MGKLMSIYLQLYKFHGAEGYKPSDIIVEAKNASRPKQAWHRGRTWDSTTRVILHNGAEQEATLLYDSTWGAYAYFSFDNKWYKISVWDLDLTGYKGKMEVVKKPTTPPDKRPGFSHEPKCWGIYTEKQEG